MAEAVTPSPHKQHFRLAYGVLVLLFWFSVAVFTYLMTRPHHSSTVAWSSWKPKNDNLTGAREIGQYVSRRYKLDTGTQLVAVQEHPPVIQGLNLEAIGMRKVRQNGAIDPYVALYTGQRTLLYAFCGLGTNCSIPGQATRARDRLLRREALELALYSFRYLRGIDTVVSLLPPAAAQQPASAVFFRKDGVEELLKQPIREVLPRRTPPLPSEVDAKDANVTDALTVRRTFPAQFEALPDGDAILVLQLDGG